jgi:hypothetical protein
LKKRSKKLLLLGVVAAGAAMALQRRRWQPSFDVPWFD